jgi:hypothetical protein
MVSIRNSLNGLESTLNVPLGGSLEITTVREFDLVQNPTWLGTVKENEIVEMNIIKIKESFDLITNMYLSLLKPLLSKVSYDTICKIFNGLTPDVCEIYKKNNCSRCDLYLIRLYYSHFVSAFLIICDTCIDSQATYPSICFRDEVCVNHNSFPIHIDIYTLFSRRLYDFIDCNDNKTLRAYIIELDKCERRKAAINDRNILINKSLIEQKLAINPLDKTFLSNAKRPRVFGKVVKDLAEKRYTIADMENSDVFLPCDKTRDFRHKVNIVSFRNKGKLNHFIGHIVDHMYFDQLLLWIHNVEVKRDELLKATMPGSKDVKSGMYEYDRWARLGVDIIAESKKDMAQHEMLEYVNLHPHYRFNIGVLYDKYMAQCDAITKCERECFVLGQECDNIIGDTKYKPKIPRPRDNKELDEFQKNYPTLESWVFNQYQLHELRQEVLGRVKFLESTNQAEAAKWNRNLYNNVNDKIMKVEALLAVNSDVNSEGSDEDGESDPIVLIGDDLTKVLSYSDADKIIAEYKDINQVATDSVVNVNIDGRKTSLIETLITEYRDDSVKLPRPHRGPYDKLVRYLVTQSNKVYDMYHVELRSILKRPETSLTIFNSALKSKIGDDLSGNIGVLGYLKSQMLIDGIKPSFVEHIEKLIKMCDYEKALLVEPLKIEPTIIQVNPIPSDNYFGVIYKLFQW